MLATISNWNEKIEVTVRHLERQIAAMRIGSTISGDGNGGFIGLNLTDDEVILLIYIYIFFSCHILNITLIYF